MSSTPSKEQTTLKSEIQALNMSLEEYSRWLSLLEGIEIVGARAEQLKRRSIGSDIDWIKPLAFEKYIQERHPSMKSDLEEIEMNNSIKSPALPCTTSSAPILA
jgi:hypothetical protein